jgi:isoleucyl-tRNA synthetase
MFQKPPGQPSFPKQEEAVLEWWKEQSIYEQTLEQRKDAPRFVFYEGPPTANGMPHPGHCLTRAIKDLFPRYRTMRGYLCERKAGWDTHGLPVEQEVCKELGIHSKEDIEAYGVEPFIQRCQQSVFRYMQEWEVLTERLGFWLHMDEAYVTYHQSYVESVWWSLKNLFDRGLLYQGNKIVWWWAQGGTALSSGEVGQGYREVADPSVYVKFPLLDREGVSLLVWTTTPWTLPSNQFAAVHPELDYSTVVDGETGEKLIMASALVEVIAGKVKREFTVESTCKGTDLIGVRYQPPFDYYHKTLGDVTGNLKSGGEQHVAWRVVSADFVTTDSGSGAVHQAPAFGEVDYEVLRDEMARFVDGEGPELICAVAPNGTFTDVAPEYEGRWVKECDKDLSRELKGRDVLYHQEQYIHEYPFCWRADQDPLIQYPRRGWFIRTSDFREDFLANNAKINWLPGHIQDGRFGNFLASNVDWALSRERFWGTPLPIWVCEETAKQEAIDSYNDLLAKPGLQGTEVWAKAKEKNPELAEDLKVHKPYIDAITYDSPYAAGARMNRVPEVIDCWYDSGAMPFAQWGYPHQNKDKFNEQFPADFISEAIDQTRGWFYSQLAISTLLFGTDDTDNSQTAKREFPHPFHNCIVLGLMLTEWWEVNRKVYIVEAEAKAAAKEENAKVVQKVGKMAKQLRNYRSPKEIFDVYGSDALRWYFYANQAPWNSIIYSERAIKESIPEYLLRLWNVYSFFTNYAITDEFDPSQHLGDDPGQLTPEKIRNAGNARPVAERGELDRWVLSELNRTIAEVTTRMDAYENFPACTAINEFLDGLSNWYVRRSRERFWSKDKQAVEKLDAYWTLYECLVTISKVIAPFTPFIAETMWQNLTGGAAKGAVESVHLCDYPESDMTVVDDALSERMKLLRSIASLGLSARMANKLKVRQPLSKVEVVLTDQEHFEWLASHEAILRTELNVKLIEYTTEADHYIDYLVQPNFKRLGPRVGKLIPQVKKALGEADGGELLAQLTANGKVSLTFGDETIELDEEDIQVRLQAKEGWAAAQGYAGVVVLSTEVTPELKREGHARDLVRFIQDQRKSLDLELNDEIDLALVIESEELRLAITEHQEYIDSETQAVTHSQEPLEGVEPAEKTVGDAVVAIYVRLAGG